MLLSIILMNMDDVEENSEYFHTSLVMLNNQGAFAWKDNAEIIILNRPGESVDVSSFRKIKDYVIQINNKSTLCEALKEAINISNGKYLLPMENFASLKTVCDLYEFLPKLKSDSGISYRSQLTPIFYNEIPTYRYVAGNIILKESLMDSNFNYISDVGNLTSYYFATSLNNSSIEFRDLETSNFLIHGEQHIKNEDMSRAVSVETHFLTEKTKRHIDRYISDIIDSMLVLWNSTTSMSLKDVAIIRARLLATLSNLPVISPSLLSGLNFSVSSDESQNEDFNEFVRKIIGGLK